MQRESSALLLLVIIFFALEDIVVNIVPPSITPYCPPQEVTSPLFSCPPYILRQPARSRIHPAFSPNGSCFVCFLSILFALFSFMSCLVFSFLRRYSFFLSSFSAYKACTVPLPIICLVFISGTIYTTALIHRSSYDTHLVLWTKKTKH